MFDIIDNIMKRILSVLFIIFVIFMLVSCGEVNEKENKEVTENNETECLITMETLVGFWEEIPQKGSDIEHYCVSILDNRIQILWYTRVDNNYELIMEGDYEDPKEPFSEYAFISIMRPRVDYEVAGMDVQFIFSNGILMFTPRTHQGYPRVDYYDREPLPVKLQRVSDQPVQD